MALKRVLIGFAESLAAIEVAASLHDSGYEVFLFAREGALTALSRGLFADHLDRIIAPEDDIEASLVELKVFWNSIGRPAIFPLDDISLWLVNSLGLQIPELAIIGARGLLADLALDKSKQIDVARSAGFAVLETRPGDCISNMKFPRFAKGALAAERFHGRIVRTGGRRVASAADLQEFVIAAGSSPVISQPCVEGVGEGVFGIAQSGRLLIASGHRRVRMMNPKGSGSSACVSRGLQEDEIDRTRKFLEACRWDGLFMLEFLRDSSGVSWFMELNGRPWGSMALARAQGFDYPKWAADLTLLDVEPVLPPPPEFASKNIESRHLGRELIHIAHLLRPRRGIGERNHSLLASLTGMFLPKRPVRFYNLRSAGWGVFLRDTVYSLARHNCATRLGRLISAPRKILLRWQRYRLDATSDSVRNELRRMISGARRMAVVCYGNINRSALAEAALARAIPSGLEVRSYGLHRRSGRPVDPVMVGVGAELGFDLSRHRSRIFTSATATDADIILVMERWHLVRLLARYPQVRGKIFLLGSLDGGPVEIQDPFGKEVGVYSNVARRILLLANSISQYGGGSGAFPLRDAQ